MKKNLTSSTTLTGVALALMAILLSTIIYGLVTNSTTFALQVVMLFCCAVALLMVLWSNSKNKGTIATQLHSDADDIINAVVESVPDPVIIVNDEGRIVLCGKQVEDLLGYTSDELKGQPLDLLIPDEHKHAHTTFFNQVNENPVGRSIHERGFLTAKRKDGSNIFVKIGLRPVKSRGNTLYITVLQDGRLTLQNEKLLASAQKNLDLLLNNTKEYAIYMMDTNGRITTWNKGAEHIKGYTEEEILGQSFSLFYTADAKERKEPTYNLLQAEKNGSFETEDWRVRKDGSKFWANVIITTLRDELGRLTGFTKITRDNTDKKKQREELELLDAQIDEAQNAIYVVGSDMQILRWNKGAEQMFGFTKEEALGKNGFELLRPNVTGISAIAQIAFLESVQHWSGELERKRKDGSSLFTHTSISVLKDERRVTSGYLVVNIDITDQKKLQQRVEMLASIVEQSSEAVFSRNSSMEILTWNSGAEKMFGYSRQEVIGKSALEIGFLPLDKNGIIKIEDSIKETGVWKGEMFYKRKDASYFYGTVTANGLTGKDGEITTYYFVITDISARKELEERLKKHNEALEEEVAKRTKKIIRDSRRFQAMIENNEELVGLISDKGEVIYQSPSAERVLGIKKEEWNLEDFFGSKVHPADAEALKNKFLEIRESPGKLIQLSYRRLNKDNQYVYLQGIATNLVQDENVQGVVFNLKDVTYEKEAERKLIESEQRFRKLIENSSDVLLLFDADQNIMYRSPSATRFSGWSNEEMRNRKLHEIVHADDIGAWTKAFDYAKENPEREYKFQYRMLAKDEAVVYLDAVVVNHLDTDYVNAIVLNIRNITEEVAIHKRLLATETRFRTLNENSSEGLILLDEHLNVLFGSLAAAEITGITLKSRLEFGKIVHPDDLPLMELMAAEVLANPNIPISFLYRFLYNESTTLWLEGTATNFLGYENINAIVVNFRDVTARKEAEKKLKTSEEKYRTLVDEASDAIFIIDAAGRFVTVNPSACRMSQYSNEELMQMSIYDFIVLSDIQNNPLKFDELKLGKSVSSERVMQRKDGKIIHVEINAKILADGRLLVFVRDISEKVLAKEQLIKEKELLDLIINNIAAAFILLNDKGQILKWNKNVEEVSGYSQEEIGVMTPMDFVHPQDRNKMFEAIKETFLYSRSTVEIDIVTKSRRAIPYHFSGASIEYAGQNCILSIGIDFSETQEAQKALQKTSAELRQLTTHLITIREEERKRIGREIHDELGQQLTAIKMDIAWIDKKTGDDNAVLKNKLKNIITLIDGGNKSIRRILSELRPVILDDHGLEESLKWLAKQFTENTGIPVEFSMTGKSIIAPEKTILCLFRVYQEALTNIARYAHASDVQTTISVEENNITLHVLDNGAGFDVNTIRTKKSFGILGMKERALSLNGSFNLESEPGKGTSIKVSLPYQRLN